MRESQKANPRVYLIRKLPLSAARVVRGGAVNKLPHQVPMESDSALPNRFVTTHWSVVLAAGGLDSAQAQVSLARLCQTYWFPIYAFIRKRGYPPPDAQDLTQQFFADLVEKKRLAHASRDRGRFRVFLMTCAQNFLHNEHDRTCA